ncbi:MAG: D-alanine aminotransferase [Firmicutes bacterium]|nr:D-alanine aminotransferase [Bacillota bacterium]
MTDYCYVNGALVSAAEASLPIADRSYLYGDGLFETMLVRAGVACLLNEHLTRISHSAATFGYAVPCSTLLAEAVNAVVSANALDTGALRLTISPRASEGLLASQSSPVNISVTARRGEPYAAVQYERGLIAVIARSTRRNEHSPLCKHKTTNFMDNVLAKKEARSRGADEAILLNTAGNIAEGAVSNLFLVSEGVVLTPRLADGALPGIMRAEVLRICGLIGCEVREVALTPDHLFSADAAFVTNALMRVMPLCRVDDHVLLNFNLKQLFP